MFYRSPAATVSVNANTNSVQVTGFDLSAILPGMMLYIGARDGVEGKGYLIASVARTGTSGGTISTIGAIPNGYTNAAFVIDSTGYNGSALDLAINQFGEIQNALSLLTGAATNLYSGSKQIALDKDVSDAIARVLYAIKGRNWFGAGQRRISFAGTPQEAWALQAFPDGITPIDAITVNGSNGAVDFRSEESAIPSAMTTDIGALNTRRAAITGTTTINSFGNRANAERIVRFTGALTLVHSAALSLPAGGADMLTAPGDTCVATSDASGNWRVFSYQRANGSSLANFPVLPQGRLTLTSGVAVTTTDVKDATSVYYTPATGSLVPLFDGSQWRTFTFSELTLPVSVYHGLGGTYDVLLINDAGTLRLVTGPTWLGGVRAPTGDTTDLTSVNGLLVNKTAFTARYGAAPGNVLTAAPKTALYLGSFYVETTGRVSDTTSRRLLFNAYNREPRALRVQDPAHSWPYTTAAWRVANNSGFNIVYVLAGLPGVSVDVETVSLPYSTGTNPVAIYTGIGINSQTVNSGDSDFVSFRVVNLPITVKSRYRGYLSFGTNSINWLEKGAGIDSQSFYGTNNGANEYFTGLRGVCYA